MGWMESISYVLRKRFPSYTYFIIIKIPDKSSQLSSSLEKSRKVKKAK